MEFNGRRSDELKVSLSEFPARPRAAEKGEWAEILGRSGALWAWMEFNGRRSDELKVSLSEFPARPRAAEKGEWAEILGRSGALWVPSDGRSGEAWGTMEIKCALLTRPGANLTEIRRWLSGAGRLIFSDDSAHAFQARLDKALEVRPVGATGLHRGANLTEIRRWLSGAGRLIFSDDSAHAFQARLDKALEVRPVGATGLHRITAAFSCQPFRYLTAPGKISLNAGQTIQNPGSCFSEPIIRVSCTGSRPPFPVSPFGT